MQGKTANKDTGRSNESWREHIHLGFPFLE
jgi:hypothetical protein